MLTFGYKEKFNSVARALLAIIVGVVLVWVKANALNAAVQFIGILLAVKGLLAFIINLFSKDESRGAMELLGTVARVVLGVFLYSSPDVFVGVLVYIIAFILIVSGLIQLLAIGSASRMISVGLMAVILPVLVISLGVLLVARPSFIGEMIGTIAGVSLIIYGISELMSSWKMKKAIDEYEIKFPTQKPEPKAEEQPQVKDVDYEKVDEQ